MYETIIVWYTGKTDIYTYNTRKQAKKCINNFYKVFGSQVNSAFIREV